MDIAKLAINEHGKADCPRAFSLVLVAAKEEGAVDVVQDQVIEVITKLLNVAQIAPGDHRPSREDQSWCSPVSPYVSSIAMLVFWVPLMKSSMKASVCHYPSHLRRVGGDVAARALPFGSCSFRLGLGELVGGFALALLAIRFARPFLFFVGVVEDEAGP